MLTITLLFNPWMCQNCDRDFLSKSRAMHLNYFAYGSNLHPLRLKARTPSCQALAPSRLSGYRLYFHKRGQDGSGKCNAVYTGNADDCVHGVVYTLSAAEKQRLDHVEGLGRGYDEATLELKIGDNAHRIFLYLADPNYIDDTLKPFDWYKAFVIEGCRIHRLPRRYVEEIRRVETISDPDSIRANENRRLLQTTNTLTQ